MIIYIHKYFRVSKRNNFFRLHISETLLICVGKMGTNLLITLPQQPD